MLMKTICQIEAMRYSHTPEESLPLTTLFKELVELSQINYNNSVTT